MKPGDQSTREGVIPSRDARVSLVGRSEAPGTALHRARYFVSLQQYALLRMTRYQYRAWA